MISKKGQRSKKNRRAVVNDMSTGEPIFVINNFFFFKDK